MVVGEETVMAFCNAKQRAKLKKIREIMKGFYNDNDNPVTYAITGLIMELTNDDYVSGEYVMEKARAIADEVGGK
jgi:beta-xylosidase